MVRRNDSETRGLRLLSYARVSAVRGREGPGFISESDQFARNRAYAEAYGHKIVEEGSDRDVSGGEMSRPIFDRFLEKIRRGKVDGLIVAKLDRFARSNVGALAAVEEIESAGGTLISVSEALDASTGAGRFLRSILFAAAQWERERIGDAWHTSRSSAVERGINVSHHVPPGYVRGPKTNDPETDRHLTPHPIHAETMRQAFRMAVEGQTNAKIADYLNERKLPVVSIKRGEKETFWQSFRVPRLLGRREYLGEARSGDDMVNPRAHEPLVDEETWLLAQRRWAGPQELRKPNRSSDTPISVLSGIVRCAGCSFAMKPQGAGKTGPAIYRCVKTSVHGRCSSPSVVTKRRVEDYVIEQFLTRADVYFIAEPIAAEDDERRKLVAEVSAAERAYRAQLENMELRAEIGDADHDRLIATLHRSWQEKLTAADALPASVATLLLALPDGISLRQLVERLRADGRNDDLRSLLHTAVEAVFVRPAATRARNVPVEDRVRIVFRGDERLDLPRRGRRFEPRSYVW